MAQEGQGSDHKLQGSAENMQSTCVFVCVCVCVCVCVHACMCVSTRQLVLQAANG